MGVVVPVPGEAAGSVRPYSVLDVPGGSGAGQGVAEGTTVYRVGADGAATAVFDIPPTDAVIQVCVSPSAQYAAIAVSPDTVANTYDDYLLPMPDKVVTHVVSLADAQEVHSFSGFGISWCQTPPPVGQ
jgi:hypothetical protein